jgi:hypothetical protein
MLLDVRLGGLVGVVPRMSNVPTRRVCMVRCLLVMPGLVMLGRFRVMSRGVAMMFRRLLVMFRSFFSTWEFPPTYLEALCTPTSDY